LTPALAWLRTSGQAQQPVKIFSGNKKAADQKSTALNVF
jgi:hypothetical protein